MVEINFKSCYQSAMLIMYMMQQKNVDFCLVKLLPHTLLYKKLSFNEQSNSFLTMLVLYIAILSSILLPGYAELYPYQQVISTGHDFTYTCSYPLNQSTENIVWRFTPSDYQDRSSRGSVIVGNDMTKTSVQVIQGEEYRIGSITCFISVNETKHMNEIHCLSRNDSLIKMEWNSLSIPGVVLLDTNCFAPKPHASYAHLHIGIPPSSPRNVSCIVLDYEELHCRWRAQEGSENLLSDKIRDEYRKTLYTVTFQATSNYWKDRSYTACSNTTDTWCVIKHDRNVHDTNFFFNFELNITIESRNLVGTDRMSYVCYPGVIPSSPGSLEVDSKYASAKQQVDLTMTLIGSVNSVIRHLPEKLVETQILTSEESLEELTKSLNDTQNSLKTFSWQCWNIFCSESMSHNNMTNYTRGTWTNTLQLTARGHTQITSIKDIMANTSVIARGRYKVLEDQLNQCTDDMWSEYTYSSAIKTEAIKPGKLEISLLWFEADTGLETLILGEESVILLWKEDKHVRYKNNIINSYLLTTQCSSACPVGRKKKCNCTIDLQGKNEVGSSVSTSISLANERESHLRLSDLIITPSSYSTVIVEVTLGSSREDDANYLQDSAIENEGYVLDVFFWSVGDGKLPTNKALKMPEFFSVKNGEHLTMDIKDSAMNLKQGAVGLTTTPHSENKGTGYVNHLESNVIIKSAIQFTSLPLKNISNNRLREIISHTFLPYTVYQFAISLRKGGEEWPALLSPNGYIFNKKAPSGSPNNVTVQHSSSTSIEVKWDPVDLQQQHGPILRYKLYISTIKNCGGISQVVPTNTACANLCPYPEKLLTVVNNKHDEDAGVIFDIKDSIYTKKISSLTVYDIQPGKEYFIRVSAENSVGESPCSDVVWRYVPDNSTEKRSTTALIVVTAMFFLTCIIILILKHRQIKRCLSSFFLKPGASVGKGEHHHQTPCKYSQKDTAGNMETSFGFATPGTIEGEAYAEDDHTLLYMS